MTVIAQSLGPVPGAVSGEVIGALGLHRPDEFAVQPDVVDLGDMAVEWPGQVFGSVDVLKGLDRVTNGLHTFSSNVGDGLHVITFGTPRRTTERRLIREGDEVFGVNLDERGPSPLGEPDAKEVCDWLRQCVENAPTHLHAQTWVLSALINSRLGHLVD